MTNEVELSYKSLEDILIENLEIIHASVKLIPRL
jgi:hypothetical protein